MGRPLIPATNPAVSAAIFDLIALAPNAPRLMLDRAILRLREAQESASLNSGTETTGGEGAMVFDLDRYRQTRTDHNDDPEAA